MLLEEQYYKGGHHSAHWEHSKELSKIDTFRDKRSLLVLVCTFSCCMETSIREKVCFVVFVMCRSYLRQRASVQGTHRQ